ncbi:MAG: four helix bundle protein [bacterium]|nr:four helix bundle protein [bacterium]
MNVNNYFDKLKNKMDEYVHFVYALTRKFPKEELYGATSQLRRAALSVILNFVEGFARKRKLVKLNFWETSYGSLKESEYLLLFCSVEKYLEEKDSKKAIQMADEIGAMLWKAIEQLEN